MDVNIKKNSTEFPETRETIKKEFLIPFGNHLMNRPIRILAVAGSLREGSYSTLGAKMALNLSKNYGAVTNFLDLRHTKLPIYDPDDSTQNIQEARHLVEWADAFVLASPDYHGSMSGGLKNFLDHFWEEFAGKTFGYICASHEKGLTVMDQMRTAVRQCYGWSLPYGISIDGEQDFNNNGEIINILLNRRLRMLARDLVVYGSLIRGQFLQDIIEDDLSDTFAVRYKSLLQEQEGLVTTK
ncbi:MAG TPA: NADPH-dependent FMN reductase [Candidatus Bathyarchaeia archaeon]|nr:NADPH-dependent FMN reductase [Candidatus Bathyarchaeia archaeon]